MRSPEDTIRIINEAIEEAETYGRELSNCTPNTGGYEIHEFWMNKISFLEGIREVILGERHSLKTGCRLY